MKRDGRWIILVALFLVAGLPAAEVRAQVPPPPGPASDWVQLTDSVWVSRIRPDGDTVDPLDITQAYVVEMLGDSTCATRYMWADCRINSSALRFYRWDDRRVVSSAANLLSFNTRSLPVTVHTGDTITFYRDLDWYNPLTHGQVMNGYISLDTLTYAVELVRARDSQRVALLDSIGVLPSITPGVPVIHGARPIMALVQYIVPPTLDNQNLFLRLRLYDRGNGEFFFDRRARMRVAPRRVLTDPHWIDYLQSWGTLQKRAIDVEAPSPEAMLSVKEDHGALMITFSPDPDGGATGIAVYDSRGQLLFYPYLTPDGTASGSVAYRPDVGGAYIVGLIRKGKLVATQKVTVTR